MNVINRAFYTGKEFVSHKEFWQKTATAFSENFEFRQINDLDKVQQEMFAHERVHFGSDADTALKAVTANNDNAAFVSIYALLSFVLVKYTGRTEIILDSFNAAAVNPNAMDNVPLCMNVDLTLDLKAHLNKAKSIVKEAYQYHDYPFRLLENQGGAKKQLQSNVLLILHHEVTKPFTKRGYDLVLTLGKAGEAFTLDISYNAHHFSKAFIQSMGIHFENMLLKLLNLNDVLVQVDILSKAEKESIASYYNHSKADVPAPFKSFVDCFEAQAELSSDKVAVVFQDKSMTYHEVNTKANAFASYLTSIVGVQPNDRVAILLDRSENVIVILAGILKARAVFVPLDPRAPANRNKSLLQDADPKLVVTDSANMLDVMNLYGDAIFVADLQLADLAANAQNTLGNTAPSDPSYIIYTSGSTGNPKGVEVSAGNFMNYLLWANNYYFNNASGFTFGFFTSLAFDLTLTSIFTTLLRGDRIVVVAEKEMDKIIHEVFAGEAGINTVKMTPSHVTILAHQKLAKTNVTHIILGGEALRTVHVETLHQLNPEIHIYNEYGPTEATIGCTIKKVMNGRDVASIGRPIDNTQVYLLDCTDHVQVPGCMGEIVVAGAGVANGYFNQSQLTEEKFRGVSFNAALPARAYYTGDLGRWLSNGELEFLGREDGQVKINGNRIEIGEIENCISSYQHIGKVAVKLYATGDNKLLAAYFTASHPIDPEQIRNYLKQRLPLYMIPAGIVQIEAIPLTLNGKIDYRALPNYKAYLQNDKTYVAPRTALEEKIQAIWQNILKKEKISVMDSYFVLGGDSIKAIYTVSEINSLLGIDLQVKDIFNHTTIGELCQCIEQLSHHARVNESIEKIRAELEDARGNMLQEASLKKPGAKVQDIYPMSDIELGMIFHNLVGNQTGVYHDQFWYQFKDEKFHFDTFRKSFLLLVEKHPILRAEYNLGDFAEPVIMLHDVAYVSDKIKYADISALENVEKQKSYLQQMAVKDRMTPFMQAEPGLWRMWIYKVGTTTYSLFFSFNHAIIDGWSRASLITELYAVYHELKHNPGFIPAPLQATHKDYIIDQLAVKQSEDVKAYWVQQLSDYRRTELPFAKRIRPDKEQHSVKRVHHALSPSLTAKLQVVANDLDTNLNNMFFSALLYLLKLTTNSYDLVVGYVTHVRPEIKDGDKVIGCFLNTVPFRMALAKQITGCNLIKQVRDELRKLKGNDKLSLNEIKKLVKEESSHQNPFFDIAYTFIDFHIYQNIESKGNDLTLEGTLVDSFENTNTHFDFEIYKEGENASINLMYSPELYSKAEIHRLIKYYEAILNSFTESTSNLLKHDAILDKQELDTLMQGFGAGKRTPPLTHTFLDHFKAQVHTNPQRIAVACQGHELTYSHLDNASTLLAKRILKGISLGKDNFALIIMDRSEKMVESILAIWKCGAAYIPIEKNYPTFRIAQIIEQARPKAALIAGSILSAETTALMEAQGIAIIDVETTETDNQIALPEPPSLDDLAYVIFTSGSTGTPKGVMIEHRGMMNHMFAKIEDLAVIDQSIIAQTASHTFDISVWQFFVAMVKGGKTVIYNNDLIFNIQSFFQTIMHDRISILELVPSYLNMMLHDPHLEKSQFTLPDLKYLMVTGETVGKSLVERWFDRYPAIPLVNAYGPTEASDDILHYHMTTIPDTETISIGKPLLNFKIYILNEEMELCPAGVKGEIVVSGIGVGRGYLNDEKRTSEVFLPDSFCSEQGRMYKTGDLGRWDDQGNMEFYGRKDHQVKIKGFRIELGEIEAVLGSHDSVKECAVIDVHEGGNAYLVAYYTAKQETMREVLREYLGSRLPDYMTPSHFVKVEEMPLSANGKIDRKHLRTIKTSNFGGVPQVEYAEATDPIQQKLVDVWKEVLNIPRVGIKDNFFDLGGDSFRAIRAVSLYGKGFFVPDLYNYPTIEALAQFITKNSQHDNLLYELIHAGHQANVSIVGVPNSAGDPFSFVGVSEALKSLSNTTNLYAVSLPRESPTQDTTFNDVLERTASLIVAEIHQKITTPVIVFGQCNGTGLALKVASLLQETGFDLRAVCMGGALPRTRISASVDMRKDDDLIALVNSLGANFPENEDDRYFFLQQFRYDGLLAGTAYNQFINAIKQKKFNKLMVPLYCITGTKDPLTNNYERRYRLWDQYAKEVKLMVIDNVGHILLRDSPQALAEIFVGIQSGTGLEKYEIKPSLSFFSKLVNSR